MDPGTLLFLVLGFAFLVGGAELVVRGSSRLAGAFGVHPLLVGLTLVSYGTSAPEVAVNVEAATRDAGGLALGNVAGSNIFNVLVVLGVSAVVAPLAVQRRLVRLDLPVLVGVSLLPLLLGLDHVLDPAEGALLLLLGLGYTSILVFLALRGGEETSSPEAPVVPSDVRPGLAARVVDLLMTVGGVGGLVLGARWLVRAATAIARSAGVSELVIGLTLVAAATSLPELATSFVATLRGERDLAIGNVVGSNIFNVLIVLGAGAVASGGGLDVPTAALTFDLPIVLAVALACLPVFFSGWTISRGEGAVFLLYYAIYVAYLFLDATGHESDDLLGAALLVFVVPLTALLAGVAWWRRRES